MMPRMARVHSGSFMRVLSDLLLLFALGLSVMSCFEKLGGGNEAVDIIRIGFIITTGEDRIRESSWNLVDMFQKRLVNDHGLDVAGKKHPVVFIIREIEGGIPEQAVHAAKELVNQETVAAIIGPHYSIDAIPAGEVAERAGIPFISPTSIHPLTTAGRKYVFRAAFLGQFQAESMARFCVRDLGAENIAILFNVSNPYSRGLAETFRKTVLQEGKRISSYESYITGEDVYTAQLERIKAVGPEVLYLPNYTDETESIAIQARDVGLGAILLGPNAWDYPKFLSMSQFYGAYVTAHMSPDSLTGERKSISDKYLSHYGHELDDGAALTYDTIDIFLHAIKYAGSFEPNAIRDALYEMGPYEGVAGVIDFIDSGDPEREAVILRLEKDRTSLVKKIVTRYEVGLQDQEER